MGAVEGPRTSAATDALPASLTEIIDAIGIGATLKLVEAFGGIRVYVPSEDTLRSSEHLARDGHPLARAIGVEAACKLARLRSGEFLDLPRATAYMRAMRDAAIRDGLENASAAALAIQYHTTRRNIFRIKAAGGDAADDAQPDLFRPI